MKKIIDEHWKSSTIHDVVLALLLAEFDKKGDTSDGMKYVVCGDSSPEHQWQRLRLLYNKYHRRFLWGEVPPDTEWYRVDWLRDRHLKELRVISHCHLDGTGGMPLVKAAPKVGWELQEDQERWACPILFSNNPKGPYTILEGNHRLLAWRKKYPRGRSLLMPVYIGISKLPCYWHGSKHVLTNDLWLKRARK